MLVEMTPRVLNLLLEDDDCAPLSPKASDNRIANIWDTSDTGTANNRTKKRSVRFDPIGTLYVFDYAHDKTNDDTWYSKEDLLS